jgi:hypothetical protein
VNRQDPDSPGIRIPFSIVLIWRERSPVFLGDKIPPEFFKYLGWSRSVHMLQNESGSL